MSGVHKCTLPTTQTTGLQKLPPNASCMARLARKLRKLIIVNPKSFRCKFLALNKSAIMAEQRKHINSPYFFMIHPFSKLSAIFEVVFFIFWTMKLIFDPILENMMEPNQVTKDINDFFFLVIQMVLIATFFFLGYVDTDTKEVVIDPKKVISRYLYTFFVFDLVAIESVRSIAVPALKYNGVEVSWRVEKVIRYVHVFCLYVRINTVLDYLDEIGQMMNIIHQVRKCMVYMAKTLLYLHFFCCLMYFVPHVVYQEDFPPDSWLKVAHIHPKAKVAFFKVYGECFMMTTCYFFGASSGNYVVHQTNEQICVIIITVFGRLYTLYLLADVLSMFGVVGLSESNYEKRIAQLKEYMVSNDLPRGLRSRMIRYYEYKLQKRHFNEPEILNTLSEYLRAEIFLHSAKTLLHKSNVFRYLQQSDIAVLISMMRRVTLAPGDILFKPDQLFDDTYFICSGTIAILNRTKLELVHLEDGDVFGLMQWVYHENDYYAIVLETTDMYIISSVEFFNFLTPFPQAQEFMCVVAKERLDFYRRMENLATRKADTCLMDLKSGRLLEKRRKRKLVAQ